MGPRASAPVATHNLVILCSTQQRLDGGRSPDILPLIHETRLQYPYSLRIDIPKRRNDSLSI